MIEIAEMIVYKAFGLTVWSNIPMPELIQAKGQRDSIDIVIEKADLSNVWNQFATEPNKFVVKDNMVMFRIPDTAIFSVQDGEKIIVSPMNGADEDKIRLYILGTCMGALLMQRKILPLHGSAIAIDGKAYAFVGESGAGKSTLASAFLSQSFPLMSDDVIAVTFPQGREPWVTPAYPQQKLWKESLMKFGMEASRYQPIFERESKFLVPVLTNFIADPLPLAGVFELVKTDETAIDIQPIQGLQRLRTLFCHTFRQSLLSRLGLMEWHFQTATSLSKQIGLYQLRRPSSGFTAPQLAELILETITKEEHKNGRKHDFFDGASNRSGGRKYRE
jgi:hypothetical protein